jgi:hypothetical protein
VQISLALTRDEEEFPVRLGHASGTGRDAGDIEENMREIFRGAPVVS